MRRYPLIGLGLSAVITLHSAWNSSAPYLGFWGRTWLFVFGTLFLSIGMILGELFRRFTCPDVIATSSAADTFKTRLFWMLGPQTIGAFLAMMAVGEFMKNVLGYGA
ncbi:hypothetical protein OB934_23290 [Aeromonas salmonicida]|uniref:hypothetical protein n=1 Tax=Aeromonas salmonicida TaxID=645 RepID=UPI00259EAF86|nr:hypothetical protein [Aeromonas salmonicida]MDM5065678.1 hypothetical protein [Aeromonas salmonicida]